MNINLIGVIAETISAIAVVVSLVYLARQIALSNHIARAEAYRLPNSDFNALNATFTTIPVFNLALRRVLRGSSRNEFNEEERAVLDAYLVSITNIYEQLYREIREGIIEPDAFENFAGNGMINLPYYRTSWSLIKNSGSVGKNFADMFEKRFQLDSTIEAKI